MDEVRKAELKKLIRQPLVEIKERSLAPSSVLFLYDSELGHSSMYSRGLVHKPMLEKYLWKNDFIDVRKTTHEEIISRAKNFKVIYLIKMADIALVNRLKQETSAAIVFELADALWQPIHRKHGWTTLEEILTAVDLIAVENNYLSDFASKFNSFLRVPLITHADRFEEARKRCPKKISNKVVIGWIGSTGTVGAVLNIKEELAELYRRNPEIEIRIIGCQDLSLLEPLKNLPISVLEKYDEERMFEEIVSLDIGLFPPPFDLDDYISRGAHKALLYMQGGVPAVCLNNGECSDVIEDGITGMLVRERIDWVLKTERLIKNPALRAQIGQRAINEISEKYSREAVFKCLENVLNTAILEKMRK